ncbi:MAG: thiamine diphosphokinase [Chthonomonas sp.]|nr:thiamine diphosphokinase [Chthonomonas sp.]
MRVLGVLAGRDVQPSRVKEWAELADWVIAADGAADMFSQLERPPHIIIGDMDSMTIESNVERIVIPDQSHSDCDKLLRHVEALGHTDITLIGLEGDRFDHVLASLSSAVHSNLGVRVILRTGQAILIRHGDVRQIAARKGQTVSLIPYPECTVEEFSGVQWPLRRVDLRLGASLSLSNVAIEPPISVSLTRGHAWLILSEPVESPAAW